MSLLEHRLGATTPRPVPSGTCQVRECDNPVYARQLFKSPTGELVSIELCAQHHGLKSIMP